MQIKKLIPFTKEAKTEAYLKTLKGACSSGLEWAKTNKITSDLSCWNALERVDWMRWLLEHRKVTVPKAVWVELALRCAEKVLPIFEKKYPKDKRVADCIKATRDFVAGKINRDELLKKRAAADAAYAYAAAAAAYAYAAYAAYAAAYAAAAAASAAAYDVYAADAAAAAARAKMRKWCADQLRELVGKVFE